MGKWLIYAIWPCEALGSLQIDIASPLHQISLCPLLFDTKTILKTKCWEELNQYKGKICNIMHLRKFSKPAKNEETWTQSCTVGGKIFDPDSNSDLSKISYSDSLTWRQWNLTVKINGNRQGCPWDIFICPIP